MNTQISKLEADILNLQSGIDLIKESFESRSQELGARISKEMSKLPEAEKVIVRWLPPKYESHGVYVDLRITAAGTGELREKVMAVAKNETEEFYKSNESIRKKWCELKKQEGRYLFELASFTEIEAVGGSVDTHAHIFAVRGDKAYAGQLFIGSLAGIFVPEPETEVKYLERLKRELGCPMYIARHPSRLATHELMTRYVAEHILDSLEKSNKK